tara:strand:+ start:905 stop:1462 length:558 start_codon:yes stop_codon:yes gene_type:complete
MRTSDSIKAIGEALLTAQKAIKFAVKDSTNPHFKSKYANINSVIDAIKPALNDSGIVFLQMPSPSDDGKLHLTTRLIHSASGEWIEDTAVCPLQKNDPQGLGSAISYLRRYSLSCFVGLYADDDDGESTRMNSEDYINKIFTSKTMEELQKNYAFAISEAKGSKTFIQEVVTAKDQVKKLLSEGG